jgi:hypothetical protein
LSPPQLAARLGLAEWQLKRAERDHLVPARDRSKGWSADLADQLADRADSTRDSVGSVPDMGGYHASQYFTKRFGVEISGDAVRELGRQGRLPAVTEYEGSMVFDGRALDAFDDLPALQAAAITGRTLMSDDAAEHLRIRRPDFDHLVRAGRIAPLRWVEGAYKTDVALYRVGALDALLADDSIDWEAVRSTPKGHRSLLAKLPTAKAKRDVS